MKINLNHQKTRIVKMNCFSIIDLVQGTPEWHSFRKNHIGASDAPVIMKESPWKTPYQLWQEKLGVGTQTETTSAMRRGINLEDSARSMFEKMTGIKVSPRVAVSHEFPFMAASFDGISEDYKEIVEIKCPGMQDHMSATAGAVPKKYLHQLLQQMIVSDTEHVHYLSYRSDDDVAILEIKRKDFNKEIDDLIKSAKEFWRCVQELEEPPLCDKDFVEMDSIEWNLTVDEYTKVKEKLKQYEKQEKEYRDRLIALSGNKNCKGSGLKLMKVLRRGGVDYTSIPELKNINLDKYRKGVIESWRLIGAAM